MSRRIMVSKLLAVAVLVSGSALASADEQCTELLAPPSLSLRDIGFDQNRAACGGDTIAAGARAFVLIDEPDFYGTLSASLFLQYHFLHASGFEFGIGARVVDYRFAQSAVFTADEFSLGPVHLDILRPDKRTWFGKPAVLSHAIRVAVPFTNSSDDNFTLAASPSILASLFLSPRTHLHGRVAGLLWSVLPESGADSRAALLSSLDLSYAPLSFASLLIGSEVQVGWYGLGLDHLQARAGLRIAAGKGAAVELSAGTALLGSERADIVTWFGYRRTATPDAEIKTSRLQDWAR